jgi:hypothetical protein
MMHKSTLALMVFVVLIAQQAFSQSPQIGFSVGGGYNILKVSPYRTFIDRSPYGPAVCYLAGVNAEFRAERILSYWVEASYQILPHKLTLDSRNNTFHYLGITPALKINAKKGLSFFAGPCAGLRLTKTLGTRIQYAVFAGANKSFGQWGVSLRLGHNIAPFYTEKFGVSERRFYHRPVFLCANYNIAKNEKK